MSSRTVPALVAAVVAVAIAPAAVLVGVAARQQATPDQRVAALKQSLAENQARLRKYEWIETTIISLKGEEKARKQMRCYYGADGKVQKVPVGDAAASAASAAQRGGGRRGRVAQAIVENKKDEMQDYMEKAVELIHQYVPPNPTQIQKAKDANKLSIAPLEQQRVRLELADYVQAGDKFTILLNAAANSLAGLNVASYLGEKDDVVALDVQFATLNDGTSYPSQTTLDAKAKNIKVVVQNTGYRPMGSRP
jgi:23S rRNA pseudoU1915 N3-methylase RlmH